MPLIATSHHQPSSDESPYPENRKIAVIATTASTWPIRTAMSEPSRLPARWAKKSARPQPSAANSP